MDGYTTLHEMLEVSLKQAGEESGMLLGQPLSISLTDSLKTTKTAYFSDLDDGIFVIGVDSSESYTGQFYLVFLLRDAIVMSSTLLGIPPARVKEKQRLSIIEADDFDAFSEIGNMINGSFNTVFQGSLPSKVRLKVLQPKKYVPEIDTLSDSEPLPDGEYLMFRSRLELAGQDMNHLDVLIPLSLGNQFDPPQEEAPPEPVVEPDVEQAPEEGQGDAEGAPKAGVTGTVAPLEEGQDSIIVLEDNEDERAFIVKCLQFTGYQVVEGPLNADIKELFGGRKVRLVVISAEDADDREMAICIKVNAMRQDSPPPVIMCAQRWTRTAALKALKYGARDIMIMPCGEDDLVTKVRKLCRMAE